MNVAVVQNQIPFLRGGAELLADGLCQALQRAGHVAQVYRIPPGTDPDSLVDRMLAARLWRLEDADLVIGLTFPAYYVAHHNKVVWLLHQVRQMYELWGDRRWSGTPTTSDFRAARDAIHRADTLYLGQARRIYSQSSVVAERLWRSNGLESRVLRNPYPDAQHRFRAGAFGDYVFMPGRICPTKRQLQMVEAWRFVDRSLRLVVAGPPDLPGDLIMLQDAVERHGLGSRVTVMGHWLPREAQAELYAGALAVANLAFDEDAYGYTTAEAFLSGKPVVALTDGGAILDLVVHGRNGIIVDRSSGPSLAAAVNRLHEDRVLAQRLGETGRQDVEELMSWDAVIEALTA